MTKQQLVDKILASQSFMRKDYARDHQITGNDPEQVLDNVALHLEREDRDFLSMLFEINCPEEANNRNAESYGLYPNQTA